MTDEELARAVDAFTIEMLHDPRPLPQGDDAVDQSTHAFLTYMRTGGYERVQDVEELTTCIAAASGCAPWRALPVDADLPRLAIPCSEGGGTPGRGDHC